MIVGLAISIFALTYIPRRIVNIEPDEVTKIEVFNGSSGEALTITEPSEVAHIISNLNQIKFQKGRPSLFRLGYGYELVIHGEKEQKYRKLILNSNDTIRYNGFFYQDSMDRIDMDYLDNLYSK